VQVKVLRAALDIVLNMAEALVFSPVQEEAWFTFASIRLGLLRQTMD
jgi:hypothetical protein